MQSKDLILISLRTNLPTITRLLEDMQDAPLTFPTPNGGNHPLWLAGHMAYSVEQVGQEIMRSQPTRMSDWKDLFGSGSEPSRDASLYPSYDTVLGKFKETYGGLIQWLESIEEEELDTKCKGCPDEYAASFGTYRLCTLAIVNHMLLHYGQVADARRAAGRDRLGM